MAVREKELESAMQECRVTQVTLEKLKKENEELTAELNVLKKDHEAAVTVHEKVNSLAA